MGVCGLCGTGITSATSNSNLNMYQMQCYLNSAFTYVFFFCDDEITNKEDLRSYIYNKGNTIAGSLSLPCFGYVSSSSTSKNPAYAIKAANILNDDITIVWSNGTVAQETNVWNNIQVITKIM